ncbi:hypothetical protein FRC12_010323 [Ceratobasidium sp. 428]|nr:hypothetical protein FRC12_010323 [Ceratobasidium sp. 428]
MATPTTALDNKTCTNEVNDRLFHTNQHNYDIINFVLEELAKGDLCMGEPDLISEQAQIPNHLADPYGNMPSGLTLGSDWSVVMAAVKQLSSNQELHWWYTQVFLHDNMNRLSEKTHKGKHSGSSSISHSKNPKPMVIEEELTPDQVEVKPPNEPKSTEAHSKTQTKR